MRINVKYVQDMILDYKDEIYEILIEKKGKENTNTIILIHIN